MTTRQQTFLYLKLIYCSFRKWSWHTAFPFWFSVCCDTADFSSCSFSHLFISLFISIYKCPSARQSIPCCALGTRLKSAHCSGNTVCPRCMCIVSVGLWMGQMQDKYPLRVLKHNLMYSFWCTKYSKCILMGNPYWIVYILKWLLLFKNVQKHKNVKNQPTDTMSNAKAPCYPVTHWSLHEKKLETNCPSYIYLYIYLYLLVLNIPQKLGYFTLNYHSFTLLIH